MRIGSTVAGPEYQDIFKVQVLDLAKQVPFLMHAMLALSSCHLHHTLHDGRDYRLPEAFHTQLASEGLRQACVKMNGVKDTDSVLTTSMLLNCLAFCYADFHDDRVERTRPSFQWLRIALGLKNLLMETKPFHRESIWHPMFIATDTFRFTEPRDSDLDEELGSFCGVTPESSEENNVYLAFFVQLAPLVSRNPDLKYMRKYSASVGAIESGFIDLLESDDSRALVLFAHWMALMCSCITWWVTRRISNECWMICSILDRKLKGRQRMLMVKPAVACGYPLDLEGPPKSPYHLPRTIVLDQNLRGLG